MNEVIEVVNKWLPLAQLLMIAGIAVFAWYLRNAFVTRPDFQKFKEERFDSLEDQVAKRVTTEQFEKFITDHLAPFKDDVGRRLTAQSERLTVGDGRFGRIEDRMAAMPTAKEVAELRISMEKLSGDVRVATTQLEGMEALHNTLKTQVQVMDEFLRKQA